MQLDEDWKCAPVAQILHPPPLGISKFFILDKKSSKRIKLKTDSNIERFQDVRKNSKAGDHCLQLGFSDNG
jgi:hypothetical protein